MRLTRESAVMIPIGTPGKIVGGPVDTYFPWPLDDDWYVLVEDSTGTDGCYFVRFEPETGQGGYVLAVRDSKSLEQHFDHVGWRVEWESPCAV
jgi:hypothetical protein